MSSTILGYTASVDLGNVVVAIIALVAIVFSICTTNRIIRHERYIQKIITKRNEDKELIREIANLVVDGNLPEMRAEFIRKVKYIHLFLDNNNPKEELLRNAIQEFSYQVTENKGPELQKAESNLYAALRGIVFQNNLPNQT